MASKPCMGRLGALKNLVVKMADSIWIHRFTVAYGVAFYLWYEWYSGPLTDTGRRVILGIFALSMTVLGCYESKESKTNLLLDQESKSKVKLNEDTE